MASKTSALGSGEQSSVEKWLENNEEGAMNIIGRWLLCHPSRTKTLLERLSTQESHESIHVLGSLDVDEEAQKVCRHLAPPNKSKLKLGDLKKMDRTALFMELLRDVISPNLDINTLSHKILVNVMLLVDADRSSLFLTDESQNILISRLFDVTVDSTVSDAIHNDSDAIKIPFGKGIAGHVAETGTPINIPDAYNVCCTHSTRTQFTFCVTVSIHVIKYTCVYRIHGLTRKWTHLLGTRLKPSYVCQY